MTRREFLRLLLYGGGALALSGCARRLERIVKEPVSAPIKPTRNWKPAYVILEEQGKFKEKVEQAYSIFERCRLCPRRCGVNRLAGKIGYCRAPGKTAVVYSYHPHFGEELPLVGQFGSGTIFFSHCNLRCVFCQNWPIAHEGLGKEVTDEEIAEMMLHLQQIGCHNINLVTPTHVMPNIVRATRIAMQEGLRIPLVYNTGGYDALEAVQLLDGIVDIYLPDLKFMDGEQSYRYTGGARDYPEVAKKAIKEMYRQVGNLVTDGNGIALHGLMIRHLVMPNRIAGTKEFVRWVAEELSTDTYVNIMAQYRVEHRAFEYPLIARAITVEEFLEAFRWAEEAGLRNLDERSRAIYSMYRVRS